MKERKQLIKRHVIRGLSKSDNHPDKFKEILTKKGIRIIKKNPNINKNRKAELYLNDSELEEKAIELLEQTEICAIFPIEKFLHVCVMGRFICFKAKLDRGNLNLDEFNYQFKIEQSGGKFIIFHSLFELDQELLKLGLINRSLL